MGRTANAQIRAQETLCRPDMNHPLPHPLAPVSELGLRPFSGRSGSISALSPLCSLGPPLNVGPGVQGVTWSLRTVSGSRQVPLRRRAMRNGGGGGTSLLMDTGRLGWGVR